MSEPVIGLLGIFALLVLIFLRMPIGFAMALVGFGGFAWLGGMEGALNNLSSVPYRFVANYDFVVIPLFLLMGDIAANANISRDLYTAAHTWTGQMRGGLAISSVLGAAGFAAISGSSSATAAAMARVAYPEMQRRNYDDKMSLGCLAAGGTMGILIPPSMGLIMYAVLTEESVGKLFMAGVIPGITEALIYIVVIYVLCRIWPKLGPAGEKTNLLTKIKSLKNVWSMLLLFGLVMGGIYGGWFTPSEAAAIGATGALVIALVMRRMNGKIFIQSVAESGKTAGMIMIMIFGAQLFMRFLAISNLPFALAEMVTNLPISNIMVLIVILIFYIFIGCFLEIFSALVLTIPIIFPTIELMGFDPLWFGILVVRVAEVGLITPPIGMNVFIMAGATGVPAGKIFRGTIPFLIGDFIHIALIIAFPAIALFLPQIMGK